MNQSLTTLVIALVLLAGSAAWAAPKTTGPAAAPAKSELDTLTETLQRAGAGANEADVIKLLQMAREAGRPFQAAPIAKAYLGQTAQPSATVLVLAAENAWLTADYRTAVTRYKSYLRATEPNAEASAAAALLYTIQLDFLGDKEDAYRFMKEYGDELRDTPAARRFDGWFLNEAKERRDLVALGKRLASAMGDKLPLEQERLYYWDYLDAGMQMLSRLPNAAEALPHFRKAVEAMREGKTRTLKYNLYVAYLDVKTGRTSDFAPVTAAAKAYFDAAPTIETLQVIGALFLGGDGVYAEAEWNRQVNAKREFMAGAFEKLDEAGKAAFLTWRYSGRPVQRDVATPEQWAEWGAKFPTVFQNADNLRDVPLVTTTSDAALLKKQAHFLKGVGTRSAAVINAVAASDDLAEVLRTLTKNESWHLAPGDYYGLLMRDVWPAYKALPRADKTLTTDDYLMRTLAAVGGETIAGTPVALFDPQAVRMWLEAVWRFGGADETDKSKFVAAVRSLDWAPLADKDRRQVYEVLLRTAREWGGQMKRAKNDKALAQVPAIDEALMLALEGRAVDVTKAPTPLCKGLTQLAQAWRKRNGAEFVKLARETYPLVRDYDVKKTPFGMAALSYLLQTGEGMAVGDFQAEVVLDQAGSSRFNAVLAAILRGRAGWNGWSDIPQNDQADAMKLNAAFEKALLAQLGQGRFSPELFNLYRSTRRGNRWSNQAAGSEVMEKMVAAKTFLTTSYRPNNEIKSAAVTYQWLVRGEFPALAAKYPVESAFDDLWVEEAQKTGYLDGVYWQFGTDSKRKIANAAAKLLMQHPTAPLGYDGTPARYSRESFWDWHERALNADKAEREAFLNWLEAQSGKGRFDEYAMGRGWLATAGTASRSEYFARLASYVQRAQAAPVRLQFPRVAQLARLAKPDDLTDAERATLRAIVLQCAPPVWSRGGDYEELLPLLQKKGSPPELIAVVPQLWRIARNTGNGNAVRALVQWADAQVKAKEFDLASAISAAGLEIMAGDLPSDARAALATVRSQSLVNIGGATPVDRNDPRYPVFAAQAAYNTGSQQTAWEMYADNADKVPGLIKELDPKFTIWLVNQNARAQQFERAETLARALVPWLESAGGAVDAETRARLLIAYAGIAFERREYPKARALFERIVTADEFNETRAKEEAELKIAEVDRLTRQYDKAFDELDKLTRRKDKMVQTEAFYQLARLKYEQEEFTDARNFLNQVLQRMPDHAEGRILEGNLDLKMKRLIEATEVKVGLTTSQRIIVPGKPLKVRLEDQNLAVVGKADSIEIRAWTASGDEEIFNLVPFGDSKTKFEGSVPTAMAATVKGDRILQVLGEDTVHYDFSDRFKKSHNVTSEAFVLTIATDSEMYASSGRILTKEEMAERQLEAMLREKIKAEKEVTETVALSLVRPPDQIKPGNKINVRVVDPDRSITAGKDKVKVRVTSSSGDVVSGLELTETDTHSGVFEGAVSTVAAQALATASNSEEGKLPNFPISAGNHPAWVALPDNVRPKIYTVDLNDNVALGKLTLRDDVAGRKLKRFTFQTSLNGREFTTLAAWPEPAKPWDGSLTLTIIKADAKTKAGSIAECRAALQQVARPTELPVKSLSLALEQYLSAANLGAGDGYLAHLRGAFYMDTRQVRTFRLDAPTDDRNVRYFFAIDGELATPSGGGDGKTATGPLELKKSFAKGVHRLDVYVVAAGKAAAKFNVQWDSEQEPYIATCPVTMFDPVAHPEIKAEVFVAPATVTAAVDNTSFELAFAPKSQARVFRFILEDFEGDAPAVSRLQLADAAGKQILPTQQDLTTLKNNQTLEIIPGDRITITYDDPKTVSPGRNSHSATLVATYMNATINACFADYGPEATAGAERRASYVPVRRFLAGDPIAVVISDPDRDTTEKPDSVQFTARTTGGQPVTVDALETDEHSGVFVGKIFPVGAAPQRATELQVKEADDITVSYIDLENTDPGVAWARTDNIEQAIYVAPQLRIYDVMSTAAAEAAVEGAGKGQAKPTTAAPGAEMLGDEAFPATRSLLATRPKEVAGVKPGHALLDGPVFVEVLFPTIALSQQSRTTIYVQTTSGRKKAGKADTDAFDINVPGTVKLTAGCGEPGKGSVPPGYKELIVRGDLQAVSPLDDGRFGFSIPMKLGEAPAASLVNEEPGRGKEPPVLAVKGGDEIFVAYEFKDKAGQVQWLTGRVALGSDSWLDVMDRKFQEALTGAHVGENIYFRVVDKSKDASAVKDEVTLTAKTSSGQTKTLKLTETFENTGIFKSHLVLLHAQDQSDTNNAVALPVQYGDTVTLSYQTGANVPAVTRTVLVYKGADGDVLPFTKRFKDPEIAVQTQFTIAESFFELAKKHRELGEESLARREIGQGKKVLEEVLRDYPDTNAKAQADYLLANLSLEFANIAVDEIAKKKHYMEAVGRFTDIVASYPESQYAPKSQFKKALTFEKMGEIDQACEEYVKLSYRYPDNELVAETIARLGQYFFTKAKIINEKIAAEKDKLAQEKLKLDAQNMFRTAAEVFGRLSIRFPSHALAAKSVVLSAQCYMRAEDFGKSVQVFRIVTEDANADKEARAEAMYWCGDAYIKLGGAAGKDGTKVEGDPMVEAYRMFKRLTWDYPESKWAKFARGRLTEPALAGAAKGDQ